MCGRARCTLNRDQVARACYIDPGRASSIPTLQMDRYRSSYNVSPGAYLPVVRNGSQRFGGADGQERSPVIHCMKWGLVPSFTNKSAKPDHFRMFNARSESIREKASFRRLVPTNRCLVAVEGFYEWKKDGSRKQPYYIHFKDERPLVFAALYDSWTNSEGETLYTFTILTTRCSSALEWLHDRMPVILGNKCTIEEWLNDPVPKYETVLGPYEDPDLIWYPVTPAMGKLSFDGPECIKKIQLKPAGEKPISKFFSKKFDGKGASEFKFQSSSARSPLKEDPGADEGQENCREEKADNVDAFQSLKQEPVGTELSTSVLDSLKEEHGDKETEKLSKMDKPGYRDVVKLLKKETSETNTGSAKREFEEIQSDAGLTENSFPSSPVKKKERRVKNTGDRQATLLSYFGKR